ncbi:hypothetical protein D9M68_982520 [compost metagenome]
MLRSARNRMRGRRVPSSSGFASVRRQSLRFQRAWYSFHASWNAMKVFPVPVASVSSTRSRPSPTASSTRWIAMSW